MIKQNIAIHYIIAVFLMGFIQCDNLVNDDNQDELAVEMLSEETILLFTSPAAQEKIDFAVWSHDTLTITDDWAYWHFPVLIIDMSISHDTVSLLYSDDAYTADDWVFSCRTTIKFNVLTTYPSITIHFPPALENARAYEYFEENEILFGVRDATVDTCIVVEVPEEIRVQ